MADLAHANENDTDLHGDLDARHWAERFASKFKVKRLADIGNRGIHEPVDTEDLMLTWFASTIETGRMARADAVPPATAWGEFYVYMAEPGYVAVRCKCGVWDQFPYFEGRTDLKWLTDWAAAEHRHAAGPAQGDAP